MTSELLARLELHHSLKDASPGFHLSDDDIDVIINLLRRGPKMEKLQSEKPLEMGPISESELCSAMDTAAPEIVNLSDMRRMARAILERFDVRPRPQSQARD
jgi:hypothetical protein